MKIFDQPVENTPQNYSTKGREVLCPHCSSDKFLKSSALLNTKGMSFLGLDWANKSAVTLICTNCGYIQWFLNPEDI